MTKSSRPVLHARDHMDGGADPIPGLVPTIPPTGSYDSTVLAINNLYAYYRLGESSEPFIDSGPNGYDLHVHRGTPDTFPMTTHVTGALALTQDDGAAEFNITPSTLDSGAYGEWLESEIAVGGASALPFTFTKRFTACGWISAKANASSMPEGVAFGAAGYDGTRNVGWGVCVDYSALRLAGMLNTMTLRMPGVELLIPDTWYFVALTADGALFRLYVNAVEVASTAYSFDTSGASNEIANDPTNNGQPMRVGWGVRSSGSYQWRPFFGRVDEVSLYTRALTLEEIETLYAARTGAAADSSEGAALVIGADGTPTWEQPKVEVTVNGEPPPPVIPTIVPPIPATSTLVVDQPFTWNGGTFVVPPHKWTTIPFTSPLMEREQTSGWHEIAWNSPDAAGWIDPSEPHAITIPHDMPFFDVYSWMQICLKLESPAVEPTTSWRELRVFETTHQKTLVTASNRRDDAGMHGGGIDLFRDHTAHSLASTGDLFASGDTGGSGSHANIMFVPYFGGYSLDGNHWLPGTVPTLKKGMRLVAQAWHNASVPLTFDCSGTFPYRPHFLVSEGCQRAWGPPWSTAPA